jgi:MFS family permease
MSFIRAILLDYRTAFAHFSANARRFLLGNLLLGIGGNMMQLLLNLYLRQLGFNADSIGTILALRAFGSFAIALPASFIIARLDARLLLSTAALLTATAFASQGLLSNFGPIAASVMFSGAFASIYQIAAGPFIMKNSGTLERVHLFSLNGALGMGTGVIGSLVGGIFKDLLFLAMGDEVLAYRMALVLGACFVLSAVVPFMSIQDNASPGTGKDSGQARRQVIPLGTIDVWLFIRLLLPGFFVGLGAGLTIPYLNLYLKNQFGLGDTAIGSIFALGQVGTFLGMVSGPALAARTGKPLAIFLGQAVSVPFILILAHLRSLPLAIVAFVARQSLMNMSTPIADNFALEQVPPGQQHLMNAIKTLNWTGSWMISARIAGSIIASQGYMLSFSLTAIFYSLSSLLFWLFFLRPGRERTQS